MAWKLIYTSAPRLLQAGRSGFGTVARHREISPLVAETAEKSSQFSRQTGLDITRVIFAYRLARSSAGTFHLLTRISDAGTDYSGRTNHLAEHLILADQEAIRLGAEGYTPAGVMLAYEWAGYEGQARWLGDEDLWQPSATDAKTSGSHWQAATTDANRVNLLASSEAQSSAVLEYPSHYQSEAHPWILWLFAESQCLCPQSGWGITFTTNVQPTDSLSDFRWLGVPDDSPVLQKLQASGRPVFNFTSPAPRVRPQAAHAAEPKLPTLVPSVRSETSQSQVEMGRSVTRGGLPRKPVAVAKAESNRWPLIVFLALSPLVLISVGFLAYALGRRPHQEQASQANHISSEVHLPAEPSVHLSPVERRAQGDGEEAQSTSVKGEAEQTKQARDTKIGGLKENGRAETQENTDTQILTADLTEPDGGATQTSVPPEEDVWILFPEDFAIFKWPSSVNQKGVEYGLLNGDGKTRSLQYSPGEFLGAKGSLHHEGDPETIVLSVTAGRSGEVIKPIPFEKEVTAEGATQSEYPSYPAIPLTLSVKAPGSKNQRLYLLSQNAGLKADERMAVERLRIVQKNNQWQLDNSDVVSFPNAFNFQDAPPVEMRLRGLIEDLNFKEDLHNVRKARLSNFGENEESALLNVEFKITQTSMLIVPTEPLMQAMRDLRSNLKNEIRSHEPPKTATQRYNEYYKAYNTVLKSFRPLVDAKPSDADKPPPPDESDLPNKNAKLTGDELVNSVVALASEFLNRIDSLFPNHDQASTDEFKQYQDKVRSDSNADDLEKLRENVKNSLRSKQLSIKPETKSQFEQKINEFDQQLAALKLVPRPEPKLSLDAIRRLTSTLDSLFGDPQHGISPPTIAYTLQAKRGGGENWYTIKEGVNVNVLKEAQQ
jgi:hypothetical protein